VIVRAADRYRSEQPGIETWHCFSAGAHYDPVNVSFGSLVGVDEHRVAPGGGFDWHEHRGVVIVSFVLDGVLRHEDSAGATRLVAAGELLTQDARDGVRHRETNASATQDLRFVQLTMLAPAEVDVLRGPARVQGPRVHLFAARGRCRLADGTVLQAGDSLRASGVVEVVRAGEVLVTVEA
jgi:redox-sensitive bicupin YhaK (pirin superfamily)